MRSLSSSVQTPGPGAHEPELQPVPGDNGGFTLLELVLAMFISSLVMGIMAVSLSFALRTWERQQNQKPFGTPTVIELLKWQLAQFSAISTKVEGQPRVLFSGDRQSITFATDHSVKAITRGVPVIARYVYSARDKRLFYAEVPLDPYHAEVFDELQQLAPDKKDTGYPRFYVFDMEGFSLTYAREEKTNLEESWDGDSAAPTAVLVTWKTKDSPDIFSYMVYPNSIFAMRQEALDEEGIDGQSPRTRARRSRRGR